MILSTLFNTVRIINNWFCESFVVLNPEKNHFMCIGKNIDDAEVLHFSDWEIKNSEEVEILGTWTFILIFKIFVEKQVKN